MTSLWIDRETWSELDLSEVGTYRYAEEAEDILVSYGVDDGPAKVWDTTEDLLPPDDLVEACATADEVWAWNAQFDRLIHEHQAALPPIPLERWRCAMALSLVHALPGKLAEACRVLGIPEEMAKLKDGKALVRLFTRPQPQGRKIRRATSASHPEKWERFKLYAANDIVSMRECANRTPRYNWNERTIAEWHCDQRINQRGFAVDMELIQAGANAAVAERASLNERFLVLSRGQFRATQRAQFLEFLNDEFNLGLDNTRSETFQHLLKNRDALHPDCAEMMDISIAANKTSTAKYAALEPAVSSDHRFRGGLQFSGASRTRRWAGRLFQPQNLPARGLPPKETVDEYIDHLKEGVHEMFHENLMLLGAAALRGVVVAGE